MPEGSFLAEAYRAAWFKAAEPERFPERRFQEYVSSGEGPNGERFRAAVEVVERYKEDLIRFFPLVAAVAVSLKYVRGRIVPDQPCITFFVREKVQAHRLRGAAIPPEIDGVLTDVVEAGSPVLSAAPAHTPGQRIRPARPGSSVSHFRVTGGTFGCLVKDDSDQYILSCAHVLSDASGAKGDDIVQPGTSHGGTTPADRIARFTKSLLGSSAHNADAAIATVDDTRDVDPAIMGIGKPVGSRTLNGTGLQVQKSGDQTGVTHGVVAGVNGTVGPLQINGLANIYFRDVVMTSGMSDAGDSGALLMDFQQRGIAILFGGQQYGPSFVTSWCTPLEPVLTALGVELVI